MKSRKNKKFTLDGINEELMPIANDIKRKMELLQEKYKFNLDFAFPEIKMEEILNPPENKTV